MDMVMRGADEKLGKMCGRDKKLGIAFLKD